MIYTGDCLEVMRTLPENSVDALVTDPPYGWRFMGKAWDGADIEKQANNSPHTYHKVSSDGVQRKTRAQPAEAAGSYDTSINGNLAFQIFSDGWAREAFRILKPGGHMLVFCGPRTYHRMASGVEDAGFEIRDQLQWLFGSGFPKSHNLKDEHKGWGTALKPANEPIVLARKPLSEKTVALNVLKWGTGALNIDGSRIVTSDNLNGGAYKEGRDARAMSVSGEYPNGTKPNVKELGGFHQPQGRWPANVIFDEEAAKMLDEQSGQTKSSKPSVSDKRKVAHSAGGQAWTGKVGEHNPENSYQDSGGASRFFLNVKQDEEIECENVSDARKNLYQLKKLAAFVQELAATQCMDLRKKELLAFRDCIGSSKECIRIQNLVSLVVSLENTDTTEIITSLWKLYGYVLLAIEENTKLVNLEKDNDQESATRFLYCAKASKSERNKGLENYERIVFGGTCKEENTVAAQLLQKVTSESMVQWLIDESGSHISAWYLKECRSTILTETSKIIESRILNFLIRLLTNDNTPAVNLYLENGGSHAANAETLKLWILNITNGKTELALGAASVALQTLSKISEGENSKKEGNRPNSPDPTGKFPDHDHRQSGNNFHATVKPVKLLEYLCRLITPPNGTILDPFLGSGTTGVAAKGLGFNFIGIEMNPEYVAIANKRIDKHTAQQMKLDI